MIEIWIDGRNFGPKGSGIAVRLQSGQHDWVRAFPAGTLTSNQAELKALELALRSIKNEFKNDQVEVHSTNRYAQMMLETTDGKWTKNAATNVELVDELRTLYVGFSNINVFCDPDTDVMNMLKKVNETCVKKGATVFDRK